VVSDTNLIDNDGEIYDDMQNIEIKPSDVFIHIWTWKKTIQKPLLNFDQFGLTSRKHGNAGKSPVNIISPEREKNVVTDIQIYADQNAMPLQGECIE
jgi:hypothetical protein